MDEKNNIGSLYRRIPKVDVVLKGEKIEKLQQQYGYEVVLQELQNQLQNLRDSIAGGITEGDLMELIEKLPDRVERAVCLSLDFHIRPVINGTGIILHTNLGRAPLNLRHLERGNQIGCGYSNLEFSLEKGCRGDRYGHLEEIICRVTGAQAALAVNNNAAAVLLALSVMTGGHEAIVSRGELVEVGGKFRIPDVMEQSGTRLVEVGTTNKTRLEDYEAAVTEETRAFLKVHTSNFKIIGFTEAVSTSELAELGRAHRIPVIEDLGSGLLIDLERFGLSHEPTVQEKIAQGADIVCFSGDKLLGGPQAGILAGKKEYIEKMKKHPLLRALRTDKLTISLLESVFMEYLNPDKAAESIPTLSMLCSTVECLQERAERLIKMLRERGIKADIAIERSEAEAGGGTMPDVSLESRAVTIVPAHVTVETLRGKLYRGAAPVIGRISDDKFWIDVRTISDQELERTADMLVWAML